MTPIVYSLLMVCILSFTASAQVQSQIVAIAEKYVENGHSIVTADGRIIYRDVLAIAISHPESITGQPVSILIAREDRKQWSNLEGIEFAFNVGDTTRDRLFNAKMNRKEGGPGYVSLLPLQLKDLKIGRERTVK